MNAFKFITASLNARKLNSFLCITLIALGVMLSVLIILTSGHIEKRLGNNAQKIDFIIGAKGSPLQLVLSSAYHIDIPTGNIAYEDAKKWMQHPQIKSAIPLALGDSYKRFRIVGTNADYLSFYQAEFEKGKIWHAPFEAVAGAATGLGIGDKFAGAHGLMEGGHKHEHHPYVVTGVLKPTGTVVDELLLTSLDSVLLIHGMERLNDHGQHEDHGHHHEHHEHGHDEYHQGHEKESVALSPEITALLVKARSPAAIFNLPRIINQQTKLQAASPAFEMARLTNLVGIGGKAATLLSITIIIIAAFAIFSGITSALENRLYDLAVLRALGFSAKRILSLVLAEGLLLVVMGLFAGLFLGHLVFSYFVHLSETLQRSGASAWAFDARELFLSFCILLAGMAASIIPAVRASRLDIASMLSQR